MNLGNEGMSESHDILAGHLQRLLRGLLSRPPVQQAIVALESGDRSFRWIETMGDATPDGRPMRPDTPFFIASIDKLYNATIVMMLSERGQLDIDEPIATYLPGALTHGLNQFDGVNYSDRITVRHLLGHKSGLADWLEDRPKGGRSLVEHVLHDGDIGLGIEDVTSLVRNRLEPHFPPQDFSTNWQRVRYSDTNFMLVIAIIEAVSGQPLHHVHEELLFKPLDLRHTYFAGHSQPFDPTPDPATLRFEGRPIHIPLLLRSSRAMYSTAADTLAFLRHFIRGKVFQNPLTLASMQEQWSRFSFPLDRAALRAPGWPIEYGLGIMRFRLPRIFTPTHPMPLVLGHTGSTGCWLFYCPHFDMLLSGSVDEITAGAVPYRIAPRILELLRSSKWGSSEPPRATGAGGRYSASFC